MSVIIPTYNRAGLIGETLESVFAQDYRPIEIVVVDDGSTDDTEGVVRSFEPRATGGLSLRYVRQDNAGAPAARNRGLAESKGEYIQFLDSDDLLDPRKLTLQVDCFLREPSADFVYSGAALFEVSPRESRFAYTGLPTRDPFTAFLRGLPWNVAAGLYHHRICSRVGPWNESLPCWQDWEYNCRMCLLSPSVEFLPGILSFARKGAGRISDSAYERRGVEGGLAALESVRSLIPSQLALAARVRHGLATAYWTLARRGAVSGCGHLTLRLLRSAKACGRGSLMRVVAWLTHEAGALFGWRTTGLLLDWLVRVTAGPRRWLRWKRGAIDHDS